jgi:hypothetical protein
MNEVALKIPDWFSSEVIRAGKIVGRDVQLETAIANLKSALLEMRTEDREARDASKLLCAMALIADEKGVFSANDDQLAKVASILFPVLDVLLDELGRVAMCLVAGGPYSRKRVAQVKKQRLEAIADGDIDLLNYLLNLGAVTG